MEQRSDIRTLQQIDEINSSLVNVRAILDILTHVNSSELNTQTLNALVWIALDHVDSARRLVNTIQDEIPDNPFM